MIQKKKIFSLLVVVGLAVSITLPTTLILINPVNAQQNNGIDSSAQRLNTSTERYSLNELKQLGTKPNSFPPSSRSTEGFGFYAIKYFPTGLSKDTDIDSWSSDWKYLEPGTIVRRNYIVFNSFRSTQESKDIQLNIVYWREDTQDTDNGSRAIAKDQVLQKTTFTLDRAFANKKIELIPHYKEEKQVTVWIDGRPDTKWRFIHKSSKTTQPISIDSRGDFLFASITTFIVPLLVFIPGGLTVSRKFKDRAHVGPQMGLGFWAIAIAIGGLFLVYGLWNLFSSIILSVPVMLSFIVAGVVTVWDLENDRQKTYRVGFIKPKIQNLTKLQKQTQNQVDPQQIENTNTNGKGNSNGHNKKDSRLELDDADSIFGFKADLPLAYLKTKTLLRDSKNKAVIITKGIRPFIARLLGRKSVFYDSDIQTKVTLPNSDLKELYFADQESEYVLRHEPETIRFHSPIYRDETGQFNINPKPFLGLVLAVVFGWFIGSSVFNLINPLAIGVPLGLIVFVALSMKPQGGHVDFDPGAPHLTSAVGTGIVLNKAYTRAKTVEELDKKLVKETTKTALEAKDMYEMENEEIMKHTFKRLGINTEKPDFDTVEDFEEENPEIRDKDTGKSEDSGEAEDNKKQSSTK